MTQSLWPDHCGSWDNSAGDNDTNDADFVSTLELTGDEHIIRKGTNQLVDAYSAFMDNTKNLMTELHEELQEKDIDTLYVAGIATDFCVSWTMTDAVSLGYTTF